MTDRWIMNRVKGSNHAVRAGRLAALVLAVWLPASAVVAQTIMPRPPDIAGSSYILMDARTGHVIMEENADEPLPPASLTKMMTAYVAEVEIDNGNLSLDDEVYISEKAWRTQGSKMFVDVDSYVPVRDLMRGIIIQSGNDASVAIAEHIGGSEEAFADLMNQHAEMLGMENSSFMNASGLDDGGTENLMSARDLAILSRAKILNHPERYELYAEREFTYNGITQPNRNTLLFRDDSVDGIKTGWTSQAGYCLVASAERDGMRLISVVMGTASEDARAIETQKMLNYGFRFYDSLQFYEAGEVLQTERVWSGAGNNVDLGVAEDVYLTIPRGASENMSAAVDIPEILRAPIEAGQAIGTVTLTLNEEEVYSGDVVAVNAVERGGFFKRLIDALTLFFINLFSG